MKALTPGHLVLSIYSLFQVEYWFNVNQPLTLTPSGHSQVHKDYYWFNFPRKRQKQNKQKKKQNTQDLQFPKKHTHTLTVYSHSYTSLWFVNYRLSCNLWRDIAFLIYKLNCYFQHYLSLTSFLGCCYRALFLQQPYRLLMERGRKMSQDWDEEFM